MHGRASIPLQRVTSLRRLTPLLRHIGCVIVLETAAGTETRQVHRGLGTRGGACSVPPPNRVGGVCRMNEVNARRVRSVPGRMTVFGRVYRLLGVLNDYALYKSTHSLSHSLTLCVTSQLGQLSLASLRGR